MCMDNFHKKFLAMKNLANGQTWNTKDFWDPLKTRYTFKNWSAKWATFNQLKEIDYEKCKSVEEYNSLVQDIKAKITNIQLTVEQIVVFKLLNRLGGEFSTYLTILNEQARREDKFLGLDDFLKNLENKKVRMRQDPVAVANMLKTKGKAKKNPFGAGSKKENKEKCGRCGKTHSGKCQHINSTCNECGKKSHLKSVCRSKDPKNHTKKGGKNAPKTKIICTIRTHLPPLICMTKSHSGTSNPFDLLLNSGATTYIVCNRDFFQKDSFRNKTGHLETGSGEVLMTESKNSLLIPLNDGNKNLTNLILTDVFFAPRLKFNLISTIKLGKKGVATYFMAGKEPAWLIYKDKVIELAKSINN